VFYQQYCSTLIHCCDINLVNKILPPLLPSNKIICDQSYLHERVLTPHDDIITSPASFVLCSVSKTAMARTALFWAITQWVVVIPYRHIWDNLSVPSSSFRNPRRQCHLLFKKLSHFLQFSLPCLLMSPSLFCKLFIYTPLVMVNLLPTFWTLLTTCNTLFNLFLKI